MLTVEEKEDLKRRAREIVKVIADVYGVELQDRVIREVANTLHKQDKPLPAVYDKELNEAVHLLGESQYRRSEDYNAARVNINILRCMKDTACLLGGESLRSFKDCIGSLNRMEATLLFDNADLSLGFAAKGMVGGFIFHHSDRTWSLHT